jgi:site-specific DNA recombinase
MEDSVMGMKRKARIKSGVDNRMDVLYARKSRITNKGDSICVQFKQSAEYAVNQLSLPGNYEFQRYEDKGLSGYYSDRPDFQRLLRDVEIGKIKSVSCYKLDRISRKTSDLMRLLEFFERHDVTLLVCSNNINTQISMSKIIIQVLAIIAEFERDILTERIQDNLAELAKDGRWLGGETPTGFTSQRLTTGSGKNKSAVSFLVPVADEKALVTEIYSAFWGTRSLLRTSDQINTLHSTKNGARFTTSSIRNILRNPIYCVADEYAHNYFMEHDGNIFGEMSEFDGQHGLSSYNKTDQEKVEDEDSTFLNPKFSQLLSRKPISEWIISVGRHEGFIPSRKWVETQNMLDEIAEKYNRPHRKTNALLSGLMYCPVCGKRLRVNPESNRWTNGKPRFKYICPGVRAKECSFKGVEGVSLDEFVVHSLSNLQDEQNEYYRQIFESRISSMIRTDQSEQEYQETKKAIERLNVDIAAQVRNLREVDDALKRFIQDDVKELTDELTKRETMLRRMEDVQSENQYALHELNGMKKRLLSFDEYAKGAQPEVLFTLLHTVIDRIYITTEGSTQKCQIYIKGCATEDYADLFGAADYIAENAAAIGACVTLPPMCDLDYYCLIKSQQKDKSL